MSAIWRIEVIVPVGAEGVFAQALEVFGHGLSVFECGPRAWRVEVHGTEEPEPAELDVALALAAASAGVTVPPVAVERLAARDWVAENQASFPPLEAARYFIHGSHFQGRVPANRRAIVIDAGAAFGTGFHATTRGCLLAIDAALRARPIRRALDLGCGSGILAFAIAKSSDATITAADNDPVAVAVARANARRNGVQRRVRTMRSQGFDAGALRRQGPFDLIAANILLNPLVAMAPKLAAHLSGGGRLILSGVLAGQAAALRRACVRAGLRPLRTLLIDDWATLVFARPSKGRPQKR
ncbi:MAG: 50S ribosomal protein L11 methyltransferase [Alphaproteobacteria bacterium]